MDSSLEQALTHLAKGSLLPLRDARGRAIAAFAGSLWITQEGDPRDTVLVAGESFGFDRDGLALVEALADAQVLVFEAGSQAGRAPRA